MKYNMLPLGDINAIYTPYDSDIVIPVDSPAERCFLMDYSEKALVAGGFLRDTLLDKPTKDVDFFIQDYPELLGELDKLGFESLANDQYPITEDDCARGIIDVYHCGQYDVIILKGRPVDHIREAFPIGLSKVWGMFNTTGVVTSIRADNQFVVATYTKTIEPCEGPLVCGVSAPVYAERIHEKYPEYTCRIKSTNPFEAGDL